MHHEPVAGRGRFYGRDSTMRALAEGVHLRRSFALCGGPRTGKSSVLAHLTEIIYRRWDRKTDDSKIVPVIVDLRVLLKSGPRFFPPLLWERITQSVCDPRVHGDTPPPTLPRADFRRAKDQWSLLRESLRRLWDGLGGTSAWCEYALLIDDTDILLDPKLESQIEPLAALCLEKTSWAPMALVAACGRPLREHLFDPATPLKFLRTAFLGALRDNDAKSLMAAGILDIDEGLADSVRSASGRHPWVLQRLCAELENRGTEIGVDGAVAAAADDCLAFYKQIWDAFDMQRGVTYRGAYAAPEHALMQMLIDMPEGCDIKTAERELGIRPLKEYAEFLEYLGVAERSLLSDIVSYRAHFDLWNVWYSERIMR